MTLAHLASDVDAERALLGALLHLPVEAAAELLDGLEPSALAEPRHRSILTAVRAAVDDGEQPDPVVVRARLLARDDGVRFLEGDPALLLAELYEQVPVVPNAGTYRRLVLDRASLREREERHARMGQALGAGDVEMFDELAAGTTATLAADPGGWGPVDLTPYLDGSYRPPGPELLHRTDGTALVYPSRVHWLSGEPEAGKSWAAMLACAQVLLDGGQVVYVDLEDGPGGTTARLLALGVPADAMAERLHYRNPAGPLTTARRETLAPFAARSALLVVDACTESLAAQGLSSKDDTDVATWLDLLPRWAARLGPAVLVLDHVVKDTESRGRWATGSQHKLSGLDGAAFALETVQPAGRGLTGRSRLFVSKDRHGQVRGPRTVPTAGHRHWAGDLVIDDSGPFLEVVLHPPAAQQQGPFRPTVLMARVSEVLAAAGRPLSSRDVEDRVSGKAQGIRQALAALVDDGHVAVEAGPHNSRQHRLVRPYPDQQEANE